MKKFGLFGFPLGHSFSKKYFTEKFEKESKAVDHFYENFEWAEASDLRKIVHDNPELIGMNVTIPHKMSILHMMDHADDIAQRVGAVNCIKIVRGKENGSFELYGYNTDAWGFELALRPILRPHHRRALILGTGGSSKAVSFVLRKLNIEHFFVTREQSRFHYTYNDLNANTIKAFQVIINCTPLGMYPNIETFPAIPYEFLSHKNLLFDLVYNPPQTAFMVKGKEKGAFVHNGFRMLRLQAEKAWEIWNQPSY